METTTVMTVPGFEKYGELTVRAAKVRDTMIELGARMDELLAGNMNPGRYSSYATSLIGQFQLVVLSPNSKELANRILDSDDPKDVEFFRAFNDEYNQWILARNEEASKKSVGEKSGKKSASSSEIDATSSPPTLDGST